MKRRSVFMTFIMSVSLLSFNLIHSAEPVSISIEQFTQLDKAMQKTLLLSVFQRRLEHSKNLAYEVDLDLFIHENQNEQPGKLRTSGPFRRCREWRLGNSYRMDSDMFRSEDKEASQWISDGFDGNKGVSRSTFTDKTHKYGRIDTIHDFLLRDNHFLSWLSGEYPSHEIYLFQDIIKHKDDFDIQAPVANKFVQLTIDYQPDWTRKPGGKRVFLLDPSKGFLPVSGTSHWEAMPANGGQRQWRIERFVVSESKLTGDVWMPIQLREEILASSAPKTIAVHEIKVTRIEHGKVKPADLVVPFTEDMTIVDAIKGVTYVTDKAGKPVGPVKTISNGSPANASK
ncbi:hypothetical protein [Gimesia sp.]|uniref:hypothetical protein n=1 Tax=Gimesia sp. TaxID=2024833 RepID=UPI003A936EB0